MFLFLLTGEVLTFRELFGCALLLAGTLVSVSPGYFSEEKEESKDECSLSSHHDEPMALLGGDIISNDNNISRVASYGSI
mmetsp:Transcript_89/g.170  ORF Transcript_89/g.170 Transcript_89/m.170 type:complete len:80 (-) Transcript_89:103-342(-)